MKVLQVGKFYHPAVGGIETIARTLSEGLVKKGIEVTVLSFSNDVSSLERVSINDVEIIRAPFRANLLSQPISWTYLQTLASLSRSYDLLHFHAPNPLAEAASLTLRHLPPYVVTYHADAIKQKTALFLYKPILHRFLLKAARISVSSSYLLQQQKILDSYFDKCEVIPFGIQEENSDQLQKIESFSQNNKNKYGDFCLFVGRLVHYKGLNYLIDSVHLLRDQCPHLKLLIVGDGPLFHDLEGRIQRLGLENQIHLLGKIEDDLELKSYYKACDFLVLPSISRAEAFGMVLLEAMTFSKPVITTRILSGVMEINLDQITGLQIEPANSEQLASALLQLTEQKELRKKLGENARNHVRTHFNVNRMIDDTLTMYQTVSEKRQK